MDQFITALVIIYIVLLCITQFNLAYYSIFTLIGMIFWKQHYEQHDDKLKYCIFVPCHNEGPVVAATVENYTNIQYTEEFYNIYFIADNCADDTASILREAIAKSGKKNFFVLERTNSPSDKRGKPHALKWAMDLLEEKKEFYGKYDMFMIFDADNFVDATILKELNSQYWSFKPEKRPVMIQAYLDSKNNEGVIARGYFENYRVQTAFLQIAKSKTHLVPAIGGTGFALDMKFLEELGGFNCTSLTEDLEIETIATLKNKRIAYNGNVRVYDEKPTRVKQSFVQRTRWAQGHWYLFFKYVWRLFISMFDFRHIKLFMRKFDMIIYLSIRLFALISLITIVLSLAIGFYYLAVSGRYYVPLIPNWLAITNTVFFVFSLVSIPLASFYYGSTREKKRILIDFIPNFVCMWIISFIDMLVSWAGLFKCRNQKVWKKTAHNVTVMRKDRQEEINSKNKKKTTENVSIKEKDRQEETNSKS